MQHSGRARTGSIPVCCTSIDNAGVTCTRLLHIKNEEEYGVKGSYEYSIKILLTRQEGIRMKMKITRQIFKAGETLFIREHATSKRVAGEKRKPKTQQTAEKVQNNNIRYTKFKLALILSENFKEGDYHISLTFKENPQSEEEYKKARDGFLRKIRYEAKKEGIDLKYVVVPHRKAGHYHYHLVINVTDREMIKKCWKHGYVFFEPLWSNPNRTELAGYLIDGAVKGLEGKEIISSRKYTGSQNLVCPEAETEELSNIDLEEEPRVFKGYVLDGEVTRYEHLITRTTCREYVLVSEGGNRRMKKNKMKELERINWMKQYRESYREEQLELFTMARGENDGVSGTEE